MHVEIVFALPEKQVLLEVSAPDGATVEDVLSRSGIARQFPDQDLAAFQAGIWGRPVSRDQRVRDGERIELLRPLELDPREARRLKAGR